MEQHLEKTLSHVVEQAIETGEPVGSQHLVARYKLEVSPSTVRNYFAELESQGFITQPHTSSGRLPTEKGYGYYVQHLMKTRLLSKREALELSNALQTDAAEHRQAKSLAKAAAEISGQAMVLGIGETDSYYTGLSYLFGQPEFKDWNRILGMSDVLDRLDNVLAKARVSAFQQPTVMIGSECPFGPLCGSVMVSAGGDYLFGVLGPMRMDYALAIALVDRVKNLLESK